MKVIDFHTHAFADSLAERVVPQLAAEGNLTPALSGKISDLLASMDRSGVERSVICSILTRPEQFEPVMKWSETIASDRIVPFASVHPADPAAADRVREIADRGFLGLKLHPFYQEFLIDEDRMMPVYEAAQACGLIVLTHAGYDVAYPHEDRAAPARTRRVIDRFPDLKLIAAHLGGWRDWDAVAEHLLGQPVYFDLSWSLQIMTPEQARHMLLTHPAEYLLFGTDSPWGDQAETVESVRGLKLPPDREAAILYGNAARLLTETAKAILKQS